MIGTVVLLPFALGVAGAVVRHLTAHRATALAAALVVASALVLFVVLEGIPGFPPARALHRFPYVFALVGALVTAVSLRRTAPPAWAAGVATALASGLAVWWIGSTILSNNAVKAVAVGLAILIASLAAAYAVARPRAAPVRATTDGALQTALAVSLAAAYLSIDGGYIGMTLFNGALAAFTGGHLLVAYVRFLRGDDAAFAPPAPIALAHLWAALSGLLAVLVLAPAPSVAAAVLASLSFAALAVASSASFSGLSRALRPIAKGGVLGLPALASMALLFLFPGA